MSGKVLMFTAVVSIFFVSGSQAAHYDSNWVGGPAGEWENEFNWNPALIPDNEGADTFDVSINSGGGEVQVGLLQSHDVNELDCYGNVDLEAWVSNWIQLILYNGLTNHNVLEIDEMNIYGDITNIPGAMLELDEIDVDGNIYNQENAIIVVNGGVSIESNAAIGGNLENSGTIEVVPSGDLSVEIHINNTNTIMVYGGVCGVNAGGIFDNNSTGLIKGFGVLYANQLLRNKGRIIAFSGSLTVASEGAVLNSGTLKNTPLSSLYMKTSLHSEPAEDVNNHGIIEVNAGGGIAFDCNLVNEPNGLIQLAGGALSATRITQHADANFAGFGSITGDVIIDPNGLVEITGPTNIVGDVNIQTNATFEVSDGITLVTGHTTNNGTIHMKGGRLIPQGGITNNGNIIWEPGLYNNTADFNLDGTVNLKDFALFADTWLWQTAWE